MGEHIIAQQLFCYASNTGWPTGREFEGHGVPIVLVGVTPHQGARESRAQGEVAQVAGEPGAVRYARCGTPPQHRLSFECCSKKATGELIDTETVTISSEGGRWKRAEGYLAGGLPYFMSSSEARRREQSRLLSRRRRSALRAPSPPACGPATPRADRVCDCWDRPWRHGSQCRSGRSSAHQPAESAIERWYPRHSRWHTPTPQSTPTDS